MKKFGIIAAMQEEMQEIQKIMDNVKETKIYDLNFIIGEISNYKVVLVEAGVGKVNAARTTQILIDNFEVDAIINVGSAAASNPVFPVRSEGGRGGPHRHRPAADSVRDCPKRAKSVWDKRLAGCCTHNWFADGEPIPHLQPEKYFRSGTRPGRK